MRLFILVVALVLFSSQCFNLFAYTPSSNFWLGNQTATVMKIANDQSMVVVGYSNGTVESFNLQGNSLTNFTGHNSSIVDIKWIPNVGPITLSNSGKVILFKSNGTTVFTTALSSSSAKSMTVTSSNSTNYVGFNFGSSVSQYSIGNSSMTFVKNYTAASGSSFTQVLYSSGYQYLFVGTNTSKLQSFSCSSNSSNNLTLDNSSTIQAFSQYGSNYIYMNSNSQFYSFTTALNTTFISNATVSSSTMVSCPSSLYIVTGQKSYAYLDVYQGSFREQRLDYLHNITKSIDCSTNYLVSVDNSNYLSITPYSVINVTLPGWAIGVISGGVTLIVIVAIVLIVIFKRRRRLLMESTINESGFQKELVSPGPSYRQEPYIAEQRF